MKDKELLKKDFQLLTSHSLINILAYQKTILENQAFIISKITGTPHDEVTSLTDKHLDSNLKFINDSISKSILTPEDVDKIRY